MTVKAFVTQDQIDRSYEIITAKARNYRFTFCTPVGQRVLADLCEYCAPEMHEAPISGAELRKAAESRQTDLYTMARAEGRRETWVYIQRLLALTPDQLFKIVNGYSVQELLPTNEE